MSLDTCHPRPEAPPGPDAPAATAGQLARAVGHLDVASLEGHHLGLLVAVAELARDAGTDWPWGPDDPTVALLRAVAKLSLVAPDATSTHAAALIAELEGRLHP